MSFRFVRRCCHVGGQYWSASESWAGRMRTGSCQDAHCILRRAHNCCATLCELLMTEQSRRLSIQVAAADRLLSAGIACDPCVAIVLSSRCGICQLPCCWQCQRHEIVAAVKSTADLASLVVAQGRGLGSAIGLPWPGTPPCGNHLWVPSSATVLRLQWMPFYLHTEASEIVGGRWEMLRRHQFFAYSSTVLPYGLTVWHCMAQ